MPGYTGTVHFISSDGAATLPPDHTFTAGDAGIAIVNVTLKTVGTRSITATDIGTPSITGTQSGIVVNPAAASTLTVTGYTSPTVAGVSHPFTVTAKDPFNNIATGYLGTVTFASSDGAAVLPANYTFVGGDGGVKSFSATLKTAGTQSITATDIGTPSITGTQSGIVVNPAAASTLAVTGYTSPTIVGASHAFTVTAKDAFNNTATGYLGTVTFTSLAPLTT